MNRKVLVVFVAMVTLAMLATPVFAQGPLQAGIVGNNPNIQGANPSLGMVRMDASDNTMMWVGFLDKFVHDCEAGTGAGRINNAIIADMKIVNDMVANPKNYYNKWVFLSGGPSGMMYAFALKVWGPTWAAILVAKHPNGMFFVEHGWGK